MPTRTDLRAQLSVGRNPLALGRVPEVAQAVIANPRFTALLIEFLWDDDAGVASRAADVLERISRRPGDPPRSRMAPHKEALIGLLAEAVPKKLRWNLALTIARLPLSAREAERASTILHSYLDDPSSIVKTTALQGLADLTRHAPSLLSRVTELLRIYERSGTPAMRARARRLLKAFGVAERRRAAADARSAG